MVTMEKTQQLKTTDRCDRCGAQAWVFVQGVVGELYFCSHHFAKHEEMLYNWAYDIVDEREFINQISESSA
jgi:ribosomal protein L37E